MRIQRERSAAKIAMRNRTSAARNAPDGSLRTVLTLAVASLSVAMLVGVVPAQAAITTQTFGATGGEQSFTVPAGTTSLTITAVAGNGQASTAGGGLGARVDDATLSVEPGQVLFIAVGQNGAYTGAFNGGGSFGGGAGGGGGGASDVRTVARGLSGSLESRLLVAPGGGGASNQPGGNWESAGGNYCAGNGGGAATSSAGGAGGGNCFGVGSAGTAGTAGDGGNGGSTVGGGGGGGWYGGGGGGNLGGGGGGSRFVSSSVTNTPTFSDGDGNPRVVLTYDLNEAPVAVADTKTLDEDTTTTTIDVLANDTDTDGGLLTVASKTNGAHGTVAITNAGADLTYVPDANYCNTQLGGSADTFTYTLNGGSTATVSVTVTCFVDLSSIALTATALAYTENDPATAVDGGATVTDPDDANLESGEVKLTNPQPGDELSYTTTNGVAGSVNLAKDTVTFSGTATKADYEAALRAVKFRNTSDNPATTPRSARFKVNDGDADSNLPTRAIDVTAVNDVPAVVLTATALAYTENDTATAVDGAATVTDPDDANLESGEVKLTNPQPGDELSYATTNGVAGAVNLAKDTVTFSATATKASYEAALRAVKFRNTSEDPSTTPRSARFKVSDGDGDSNLPTRTVNVGAVNDGPQLSPGGGTGFNFQFKWGTVGFADGQMNYPYDMAKDSAGNLYVVEASNARVQKFSPTGAFLARFGGNGSANGQFNWPMGIAIDANDNIYVGDHGNSRVQKFSSNGTFLTKWASGRAAGLEIAANGDVYVAEFSGSVARFTSSGTLVTRWGTLGSGDGQFASPIGLALDSTGNVYVTDHSANRVQKFTATGAFVAKWGSPGAGPGQFNYPTDIEVDASGDVYVSEWGNHRVQKFTPNGMFLTQWGSYGSNDGQFNSAYGMVFDGEGGLYVADARNNRIQRFAAGPVPLAYTEGQAATAVLPDLTAFDAEQANLVSATVSITAGLAAGQDLLAFTSQSGIVGAYNADAGVLTLTGTATVAQYQAALRTVTYRNTSVAPSTAPRTISFRASDGIGQGTVASRSVNITAVNSAPTVSTSASTLAYATNQAATAIDPAVALADIDNLNLVSASVAITGGLVATQDVLAYTNANGINGSYAASTGVLTLSGTATLAQYQLALRSVTYRNTSSTPSTATRTARFTVNDGATTGFATRDISVNAPNVAPSITTSATALSYTENAAATAVDDALTVADPDSPNLVSARVSISANFAATQDVLAVAGQNGISGAYGPATGVLTLTGVATRADYETALRSVTYRNTSDNPTVLARTVSFVVNDGTVDSPVKTRQINVVAVNDAPVFTTTPTPLVYDERSGPQVVDPGLEVSDVDSPQLTLADVQLSGFTEPEDWLSFTPQAGLTIYQPFAPTRSYTVLSNPASAAIYRSGLRGIKFSNTSSKPSTQVRTVRFVISDGNTATVATRTLTINPVNEAPTAKPDSYATSEATTLTVSASGVLANDIDLDGPALSVSEVAGSAANVAVVHTTARGAKVTINANGALSYNPNGRFAALNEGDTATDSVTYKASDGTATSALATVTFTISGVSNAPVAVKDAFSVSEDGTLSEAAPGVLANDAGTGLSVSEVDGSALSVGVQQTTAKGAKITVNADGSLSYDPDGQFDGLDSGETATDSITYRASDDSQSTNVATVTITITGANDAPVASADAYSVDEDAVITRAAPGVLGDDSDVDGDDLTVGEVAGSPAHVSAVQTTAKGAKVTINADGSLVYDPNGRFEGLDAGESDTDAIDYRASDGDALSATTNVTFTIDGANDAPAASADAYTVAEDATLSVPAAGVLGNDDDADGETIEVAAVAGGSASVGVELTTAKGAKVTIDADGSVAYDPNGKFEALDTGESTTDSIAYEATDATIHSAAAKVTFTITGSNDAPTGSDDAYAVGQNGTVSIPASGVLANDFDVDVEAPTVSEVGGSADNVGVRIATEQGAAALIDADGALTYSPDGRFIALDSDETATDSFTYRASDGDATSELVTVTITVYGSNDVPTAIPDTYSVAEDGALSISADGLAGNDGDVDQEGLTIAELEGDAAKLGVEQTTGGGGTVTVNQTGSLNYDPNGAYEHLDDGETGTDSFTYKVTDGTDTSALGTVTIKITGENDAPVARADALEVGEDSVLSQASPGVLANDNDADLESLTVAAFAGDPDLVGVQQTTDKGAKVTLEPDGSVSYDPNGRFEALDTGESQTDSFQYTASDGSADSDPVTATITIHGANDAPAGAQDAYSVGEDATLQEPAAGVLGNDADVDGENLTVGEVDGSPAGVGNDLATARGAKVTIGVDGALAYDPNGAFEGLDAGETGRDSISYRASDGTTTSDATAVTFTVEGANDAPVALDDGLKVAENEVLSVDAAGLLDNDTDPDVEALEIDEVAGDAANVGVVKTTAKGAKLLVNADGSVTYDPNGQFEGLDSGESDTDSVTYRVTDGDDVSNVATLTITVNGANDVPVVTATASALAFDQGDAAMDVDGGLTLVDTDDADLTGAQVTLTDAQVGDELSYATTAGVTAVVNAAQDTVTFSGTHSIADYQTALRAVRFFNGIASPSADDRHVTFTVNDGDDDSLPATRTIDFTLDTSAPDSEITSGPSGDTASNDATFAFAATAANPGGKLRCRLDGPGDATEAFADCTSPKTYLDLADGAYTFRAYAVDAAGNEDASAATRSFRVDTVVPLTTHDVPATVQAADVTVTLMATDDGSGIDETYYTTGTSPADPTIASAVYDPASKPTLGDGELIRYFSLDKAGNAESVKSSPAAKVNPNAPITTDNVPAAFGTTDVTVTLTAADHSGAGPDRTYYTTGTSPADPTTASAVYDPANKPTLGDGERIKYFSTDMAGNVESVKSSAAAKVDRTAPVTTDNVPATAQAIAVAVTLSATDAGGSAVATTYYTKGATPADPTLASSVYDPASKPTLANGERVKYFSTDNAGNQEAVRVSAAATVTTRVVPPPPAPPAPNVIRGTAGNDTITGTSGDDVIYCGAGDDVVKAGAGDDIIDCGDGADRVDAGAGNDLVFGRDGNDRLIGSSGTDSLVGGDGDDRLSGGAGKDRLRGNRGRDRLYGQAGNDRLSGGTGDDELTGAAGHDRLSGDQGADRLWGGAGNDRMYGRAGDDRLSGGADNDRLSGGAGEDRLLGGTGIDRLIGGSGIDILIGGPGVDRVQQ